MKKVGMLGSGAWGTAMASLLADNGHTVYLWCYEKDVTKCISEKHINDRYLPEIPLSPLIMPTTNIEDVFAQAEIIFEAIPVPHMRRVFEQAKPYVRADHRFVVLSKGLEQETLKLPSQIIMDVLGCTVHIAGVAGPSFAHDVALKYVTGLSVASSEPKFIQDLQALIQNDYCRTYSCDDLIGVQCGGAFKNVLALGLGILDGANCADNTKAFVFTRGLAEMALCAQALGGKKETLYGLSGVGDLVLTSMGHLSRNAYLGQCLGQGKSVELATKELGTIPEGINTVQSVYQLAKKHNLDLPVFSGIREMVECSMTIKDFLNSLITHHFKADCI